MLFELIYHTNLIGRLLLALAPSTVGNIELNYLNIHLAQHMVTLNTEQSFDQKVNLGDFRIGAI